MDIVAKAVSTELTTTVSKATSVLYKAMVYIITRSILEIDETSAVLV